MKSSFRMQATKLHCLLTQVDKFRAQMCLLGAILKGRQEARMSPALGLVPALFLSSDPDGAEPLRNESSRSASICPQRKTHLPRVKCLPVILLLGCARSCQSSFSLLQLWGQTTHLGPQQLKERTENSFSSIAC